MPKAKASKLKPASKTVVKPPANTSLLARFGMAVIVVALCVIGWFVWAILTDKPPTFFPLNDKNATYAITKNCPGGQGWVEASGKYGDAYCLEYRGDHVFMKETHDNSEYFSITIGRSNIDLEPLVGRTVKNIDGEYASASKQCVLDVCTDIGGPYVVVNINSLEMTE